jgi:carnitine O-acetyltransferase
LDAYTYVLPPGNIVPPSDSPQEVDAHVHNIRSSAHAHNRWFDKSFTLIVESNTRAGVIGEHSPCDALVPSIVGEYAIAQGIDWDAEPLPPLRGEVDLSEGWERLDWVTDDLIKRECVKSETRASALIEDSDDSILWFTDYGADWIKSVGVIFHFSVVGIVFKSWTESPVFTRRLPSNGLAIGLVPNPRLLHGNVRNSLDAHI